MQSISAIIRVKPDQETVMRNALLAVAEHVRSEEPETLGFFVSQGDEDPCLFTTYERFADKAAMDRHNVSKAVADFFAIAGPILDGTVTLVIAGEVSASS
ncbi:MAG: putative quinol monooxygenase [Allorhizobium sp.]